MLHQMCVLLYFIFMTAILNVLSTDSITYFSWMCFCQLLLLLAISHTVSLDAVWVQMRDTVAWVSFDLGLLVPLLKQHPYESSTCCPCVTCFYPGWWEPDYSQPSIKFKICSLNCFPGLPFLRKEDSFHLCEITTKQRVQRGSLMISGALSSPVLFPANANSLRFSSVWYLHWRATWKLLPGSRLGNHKAHLDACVFLTPGTTNLCLS
jgi:hypothetical protein